ncbi:hypothetical protein D9757_001912 [Collybiopsis confluens]|uniref:RWD domain-containing protein n=1 Tax=Collybiopsis confluens TaxID=2823264 RepID=A0A8H5HXN2_9AGAR|nr:hypothetical protein D9757_001912 [Collybiopsis confluens]
MSVLTEEFEVLEAIYPNELTKSSENDVTIVVEPEQLPDGLPPLKLSLNVHYTDDYPDVLPELSLYPLESDVEPAEIDALIQGLIKIGEENLGMAMTFTLVSHLREQLVELVQTRDERRKSKEAEKERLALEEEEMRTRGTPVTADSFKSWKAKFDRELAERKTKEEDERLRGLSTREREEQAHASVKALRVQLSLSIGRQLFERNRIIEEENLMEEGTISVDISQYERSREEEEEEEEHVTFSDSD